MKESTPRRTFFRLLTWLVIASQVFSQAAFADSKDLNKAPQKNLSENVAAWSRVDLLGEDDGDAAELDRKVTPVPGAAGFAETGTTFAGKWRETDVRLLAARYVERKRREAGAAFDLDQAERQLLDKLRRSRHTNLMAAVQAEFARLRRESARPGGQPSGSIAEEKPKVTGRAGRPKITLEEARRLDIQAIARSVIMISHHVFRTRDGTSSPVTRKLEDILSRRTIDWYDLPDKELAKFWVGCSYCVFSAAISAAYQRIYIKATEAKRKVLRRDLLLKMTRMVSHEVAGILTGINDREVPEREAVELVIEYYAYHRLRSMLETHGWYDLRVGGVADEFRDEIGWIEAKRLRRFRELYGRFSGRGMLRYLIATLDRPDNELVAVIRTGMKDVPRFKASMQKNGGRLDHQKISRLVWDTMGLNPRNMDMDDRAMPTKTLKWLEGKRGPVARLALADENMLQSGDIQHAPLAPAWAAAGAIEETPDPDIVQFMSIIIPEHPDQWNVPLSARFKLPEGAEGKFDVYFHVGPKGSPADNPHEWVDLKAEVRRTDEGEGIFNARLDLDIGEEFAYHCGEYGATAFVVPKGAEPEHYVHKIWAKAHNGIPDATFRIFPPQAGEPHYDDVQKVAKIVGYLGEMETVRISAEVIQTLEPEIRGDRLVMSLENIRIMIDEGLDELKRALELLIFTGIVKTEYGKNLYRLTENALAAPGKLTQLFREISKNPEARIAIKVVKGERKMAFASFLTVFDTGKFIPVDIMVWEESPRNGGGQALPFYPVPPVLKDRAVPLVPTPLIAGIFDLLCYFNVPRPIETVATMYFEKPTAGDRDDIEKTLRFLYGAGLAQKTAAGYSVTESARHAREAIVDILGYITARRQVPEDMRIPVVVNFRREEKPFEEFKALLVSGAAVWWEGKWRLIRPADVARAEQLEAAKRSSDQEAAIEAIKARTRKMNAAMANAGKDALDLSNIFVVMKRMTPDSVDPRGKLEFSTRNTFLSEQYNTILASLRDLIPAGNMRIVGSNDEVISAANALLGDKKRVIVLDADGSLTEVPDFGLFVSRIKGVPARDYCVVGVDAAAVRGTQGHKAIPDICIAFTHLEAMVKIGIAVLCDNRPLFEDAYEAFTGARPDEPLLDAFDRKIKGVIKALPVTMPFDPNTEDERRRLKQFFIDMAA